jgi:hypothetical protein
MFIGVYSVVNEKDEKIWDVTFFKNENINEVYDLVGQIIDEKSQGSENILVKDFELYEVQNVITIDLEKLNEIRRENISEMSKLKKLYTKKDLSKEDVKEMMSLSLKYPELSKTLMNNNGTSDSNVEDAIEVEK